QESCCHHPCKARFRLAGLAFTGRASNPLDRCKRFQIIHPPFLDLAWRKGSFILNLPLPSHHSITSSARASRVGGISSPSAFAVLRLMTRNATGFALFEFSMGTKWLEMLRELVPSVKKIGFMSAVRSCCRPTWNVCAQVHARHRRHRPHLG